MVSPFTTQQEFEHFVDQMKSQGKLPIGALTKQAMIRRVESGGIAGKAPRGYENIPDSGGRVRKDSEAPGFQKAFELIDQGLSIRDSVWLLVDQGVTDKRGGPINPGTLHNILTNPFYMGKVRLGDRLVQGTHEPLVSEELFNRVQEKLAARSTRRKGLESRLQ